MLNVNILNSKTCQTPRNPFDMSEVKAFDRPLGLILPTYFAEVLPGDYVKGSVANFTRTNPLNTAAFTQLKEKIDFYFVPTRLIYSWFSDFISNTADTASTSNPNGLSVPNALPYITGGQIAYLLQLDPTTSPTVDCHGYDSRITFLRILDLLGMPVSLQSSSDSLRLIETASMYNTKYSQTHFNFFPIYALGRLYHDFYRNSDYEANDPYIYNLDKYTSGSQISNDDLEHLIYNLCGMLYMNVPKDYFTSCKPSPLYVAGATPQFPSLGGNNITSDPQFTAIGLPSGPPVTLTVMATRSAYAVEKMAQLSMLAPKTYAGQMKAHFGVTPDHCSSCSCVYLGTHHSSIQVNPVIATANGNNGADDISNVFGQVAGQASGGNSSMCFQQKFDEHGFIFGLHVIYSDVVYQNDRLPSWCSRNTRSNFYQAEFDSLGLEPVFKDELSVVGTAEDHLKDIFGYHARYASYKTTVNSVHGEMSQKGVYANWMTPYTVGAGLSGTTMSPSMYKFNPAFMDKIMYVVYDGKMRTDPFLCHHAYNMTFVRNMSVHGIPNV